MLAAEMKKGIKCFVQGSVDLQDEKSKIYRIFWCVAETPESMQKMCL